jgi:hypothetical protein
MVHATGMSLDPKKSKNTTCRRLLLVCRKVATVLRKSDAYASSLRKMQDDEGLHAIKIRSDVTQRWASVIVMIER